MNACRPILCLLVALVFLPRPLPAQQSGERVVPGELLVKFRASASPRQRNAALARKGARILRHFAALEIDHIAVPEGTDLQAAVRNLLAQDAVELAQPNYVRHVDADQPPNDPYWRENTMWGLAKIQAQPAWIEFGGGDGSVVLADIDTGANYNHPDLAANIWQNPGEMPGNGLDDDGNGYVDDVHGIDAINHDGDPMDDHGHGTHTTGTMAAIGNNNIGTVGVSWNAKVVICKAFDNQGSGSDAAAVECLNYLVSLKQHGINLRASNSSWGEKLEPNESFPTVLKAAFDAAGAENILNVCSAGNDGTNNDADPYYPATFDSPGIVSVAASDGDDNRGSFSDYGATTVDLAAPGLVIMSTIGNDYGFLTGTSMATPHVTGSVAMLSQLNPGASAVTIKTLLMNNVDVVPQWAGLSASGGRLNLYRAAQAAAAGTRPLEVAAVTHQAAGAFEVIWPAVPGMRYQIYSSDNPAGVFSSLSEVIVAGPGENALSFTDLNATGPRKFYRVTLVR